MAELIRRELCCYGTAVHTTAQTAVNNLAQIRTIGEHLQDILTTAVDKVKEEPEEECGYYAKASDPNAPKQRQQPSTVPCYTRQQPIPLAEEGVSRETMH